MMIDTIQRLPCWNSVAFIVDIIQIGNDGSIIAIPTLPNEIAPENDMNQKIFIRTSGY